MVTGFWPRAAREGDAGECELHRSCCHDLVCGEDTAGPQTCRASGLVRWFKYEIRGKQAAEAMLMFIVLDSTRINVRTRRRRDVEENKR